MWRYTRRAHANFEHKSFDNPVVRARSRAASHATPAAVAIPAALKAEAFPFLLQQNQAQQKSTGHGTQLHARRWR